MEHVNFMLEDQRKFKKINLAILLYIIARYLHNIYIAIFITLTMLENFILTKNIGCFYFKCTNDKSVFGSIKSSSFMC
jgi:hypothetical protein